jgi:hypothetical protein
MPTVSEDGNQYTEDQLRDYVIEYGPIDYLTGEELPKFKSKKDAIGYAINRSNTRKETGEAYGYFKGGAASLKDQTESAFDLNKDKTEVQEELVAPITVSDLDSRPLSLLDARDDDRYLGEFDGGHMFIDRLGKTYTISGTAKPEDNRTGAERWKENLEPAVSAAKLWWEEGADLPSVQQIYGVGKAVAEGVYDTVSKISGAATGKVSGDDITLADTFDATAGMGVGSSLVKVPEGSLRIFGGLHAKNAPDGDEITNAFNSEFEVFKDKVKSDEIDIDSQDYYEVLNSTPSEDGSSYIQMRNPEYPDLGWAVPDGQPKALAFMTEFPDSFKKTLSILKKNKDNYSVGKDGLLRFEIDDSKAKIKNTTLTKLESDHEYRTSIDELEYAIKEYSKDFGDYVEKDWTTLEDVLDHPDLFDQYPELKEVAVVTDNTYFKDPKNIGVLGYFNQNEGIININPELSDDQLKSTLLHEVQHAVQKEENFQGGANSDDDAVRIMLKARSGSKEAIDVWREYNKKWKTYERELKKYKKLKPIKRLLTKEPSKPEKPMIFGEGGINIELVDGYFDPMDFSLTPNSKKYIVYSMASGEVEARNVQRRMYMTPFQRKHYKPEVTEDVSFSSQWADKDLKKAIESGYDSELSYSKSSKSNTVNSIPKLEDFGFKTDNPGGDWLESKLRFAERSKADAEPDTYRANLGNSDGVTGYFQRPLNINPKVFKDVKGAMGEENFRPDPTKLKNLKKNIAEEGYDKFRGTILIHVREDGEPFIVEGNHRIIEAIESDRPTIPVEIKYLRGAEEVQGDFSPEEIIKYADKKVNDNE